MSTVQSTPLVTRKNQKTPDGAKISIDDDDSSKLDQLVSSFSDCSSVSTLSNTTTEEFEGEGGTVGSVTTESSKDLSGKKQFKPSELKPIEENCTDEQRCPKTSDNIPINNLDNTKPDIKPEQLTEPEPEPPQTPIPAPVEPLAEPTPEAKPEATSVESKPIPEPTPAPAQPAPVVPVSVEPVPEKKTPRHRFKPPAKKDNSWIKQAPLKKHSSQIFSGFEFNFYQYGS